MLALLLFVAALIHIARSHHLSGLAQAVWVLVLLAFPVAGPILWFLIGRRTDTPACDGTPYPRRRWQPGKQQQDLTVESGCLCS